jgi:O-antigen ligase
MSAYQTYRVDTLHFAEAHDDYLQLLAEGGVLLAVPAVVVIALFVREVRHRFRERLDDLTGYWIRVGAVTGVVAIGLQELVDFSLQMPGNAALFALLCAIAVRRASGRASPRAAP